MPFYGPVTRSACRPQREDEAPAAMHLWFERRVAGCLLHNVQAFKNPTLPAGQYISHRTSFTDYLSISRPMMVRPAPPFPIGEAHLVSLFTQSIAFGIHLVVFATCIHRCFQRSRIPGVHSKPWPWVVVATTLFVIGMADASLNLHRNLVAFIFYGGRGGANFQLKIVTDVVRVSRSST